MKPSRQYAFSLISWSLGIAMVMLLGMILLSVVRFKAAPAPERDRTGQNSVEESMESDDANGMMIEGQLPMNWGQQDPRQIRDEARRLRAEERTMRRAMRKSFPIDPAMEAEMHAQQMDFLMQKAKEPNSDPLSNRLTIDQVEEMKREGLSVW